MNLSAAPSEFWNRYWTSTTLGSSQWRCPNVKKLLHSYKFRSIHMKTPVMESLIYKAAGLEARDFLKKRLQLQAPGVFLWTLRNFQEHLFWRISVNSYLYTLWTCNGQRTALIQFKNEEQFTLPEAVVWVCSAKKVFLGISQN